MDLSREYPFRGHGLLYPMLIIAAVAVIVFSIMGIATIAGWMPSTMIGDSAPTAAASTTKVIQSTPTPAIEARNGPAFQCAECGVIDTVRDIDRRGDSPALEPVPPAIAKRM